VVDKDDREESSSEEEFEMVQDSEDEVSVESRRKIDKAAISDRMVEINDILERHVRLCNAQDLYNKGEDLDFEHFKVLIESRGAKLGRAKAWPISTTIVEVLFAIKLGYSVKATNIE
jgi:hypothetical protein